MRKIFLSFLGTGKYMPCIYQAKDGQKSRVVTYVQSATLDLFCPDYDERLIFTTEEAKKTHWAELEKESPRVKQVDIPSGKNEDEIWQIFQIIFDSLQEDDILTLDITHGYRHIPLIASALLQYAKFLKNVSVKGIYYGAFEVLGNPRDITERIPKEEDRIVPIFDLTSFSLIQDWATATDNFINFGNASLLTSLTQKEVAPVIREDKMAQKLKNLSKKIDDLCKTIKTNRCQKIIEGRLQKDILDILKELEQNSQQNLIPALTPILDKMQQSVENTYKEENDTRNMLSAVEWCIEKGLVQEGLTILQEGIISCILKPTNYIDKNNRQVVTSYLPNSDNFDRSRLNNIPDETINKIKSIVDPYIPQLSSPFKNISALRNDINHAGMIHHSQPADNFLKKLEEFYKKVKEIFDI